MLLKKEGGLEMKDNLGLTWKQITWVSVFSRRDWLSVRLKNAAKVDKAEVKWKLQ